MSKLSIFAPEDAWKQGPADAALNGLIARLGSEKQDRVNKLILDFNSDTDPEVSLEESDRSIA